MRGFLYPFLNTSTNYIKGKDELKKAYEEMLTLSMEHESKRQWYAAWFVELLTGERIGDLCFKGLSSEGMVEIGYGFLTDYWGCGYATEAVSAMTNWALEQDTVKRVEAEIETDNIASQRVLEKVGFVPTGKNGEEGPRFELISRRDWKTEGK